MFDKSDTLWVDNTNEIWLGRDAPLSDSDGTPVTGAAASVTIYNASTGSPVAGTSWPLVMTEDGCAVGSYRAVTPPALFAVGTRYRVVVTATDVGGNKFESEFYAVGKRRGRNR